MWFFLKRCSSQETPLVIIIYLPHAFELYGNYISTNILYFIKAVIPLYRLYSSSWRVHKCIFFEDDYKAEVESATIVYDLQMVSHKVMISVKLRRLDFVYFYIFIMFDNSIKEWESISCRAYSFSLYFACRFPALIMTILNNI